MKQAWKEIVPITKGWSGDQKFRVTDQLGTHYLLRISPAERYQQKQRQYVSMQQVAALGVPMCLHLDLGRCSAGVYMLHSWICGEDAETVIPALDPAAQYAYGLTAGQILRRIHTIPAPADSEGWATRFNRKIDRKIRLYRECPLCDARGEVLIAYIQANRQLLSGRSQTYQHGDYHIGNMMVDTDGRLCILDFDRDDFGDPWEEFNRIVWCAQQSPLFASGMVDGYFEGSVPPLFWRLLALYIATNTLSSVPWAIPFGQEQVDVMLRQAEEVLAWYDQMRSPLPRWYQRPPETACSP